MPIFSQSSHYLSPPEPVVPPADDAAGGAVAVEHRFDTWLKYQELRWLRISRDGSRLAYCTTKTGQGDEAQDDLVSVLTIARVERSTDGTATLHDLTSVVKKAVLDADWDAAGGRLFYTYAQGGFYGLEYFVLGPSGSTATRGTLVAPSRAHRLGSLRVRGDRCYWLRQASAPLDAVATRSRVLGLPGSERLGEVVSLSLAGLSAGDTPATDPTPLALAGALDGDPELSPYLLDGRSWDVHPQGEEVCFVVLPGGPLHERVIFNLYRCSIRDGVGLPGAAVPLGQANSFPNSFGPVYSPSGRYICFASQQRVGAANGDFPRLYLSDREDAAATPLQLIGGELAQGRDRHFPLSWAFTSETGVLYRAVDRGQVKLFTVELEPAAGSLPASPRTGPGPQISASAASMSTVTTGARTGDVVVAESSFFEKPSLRLYPGAAGSPPSRLLDYRDLNESVITETFTHGPVRRHLLDPKRLGIFVTFPPSWTKEDLQGKPREPAPLVHLLHGGPFLAWSNEFSLHFNPQILAQQGFVVVQVNFHGSLGHPLGEALTGGGHWKDEPVQDLVAATRLVAERYGLDATRVRLVGGSYGGYLGAWLLGQEAEDVRFTGAALLSGVYEPLTLFGTEYSWVRNWEFNAAPWQFPQELAELSPLQNSNPPDDCNVLLVHGTDDVRVPEINSILYHRMLIARGKPTKLIRMHGMGHAYFAGRVSRLWTNHIFPFLRDPDAYLSG